MQNKRRIFLAIILIAAFVSMASVCRRPDSGVFTIALDGKFSTLDPIGSITVDANAERLRTLMYNSLIKKDAKFEYVGDLAEEFSSSEDGLSYTFKLRENVKFHNGNVLSSADVKYTMDKLIESEGAKGSAFFETIEGKKTPIITAIETPDEKTIVIKISRPELKNKLIPNLVPVAIVPKDSKIGIGSDAATNPPPGTGTYKFKSFDQAQNIVELDAFDAGWEGVPNIKSIRVKVLSDANALQAELLSGRIDLAPNPTNLSPDTIQSLGKDPALKVETFDGSNVQYIGFNFEADPVNKTKVRQAIAYAINRERIIADQLNGNATLANSILPDGAWAYSPGTKYDHDVEKAKKLLDEAGYKDTDGDGVREMKKIVFKISSGSKATQEYAVVMESQLKAIGVPISIESLEGSTMRSQVKQGQFMMTTGRWVGGNQDPIFLHDLFASTKIPIDKQGGFNRWRFKNTKADEMLEKALKELDREKAKEYFVKAQEIISQELPLFPLWYSKNVVISKKNVGNIEMNASGDWDFVRKMTVQ